MTDTDIEDEIRKRILEERRANGAQIPAGDPAPTVAESEETNQPYYMRPQAKKRGGILGALTAFAAAVVKFFGPVLALLGKLKFLLVAFKLLITFGSMFVSMWLWAKLYGWPFGIGIVLLIFIHECGHALAARLRGLPVSNMVFIPFMGAFVVTRGGRSVAEDAFIGIMGPAVGSLACVACVGAYAVTHDGFWLALAAWGFFVNLFNLAPTVPLDGGWIAPVFSPKVLAFGVVVLLLIGWRNPLIWVLGVLSIPRIVSGWNADPKTQPYYQITTAERWKYGAAYFGLAAALGGCFLVVSHMVGGMSL